MAEQKKGGFCKDCNNRVVVFRKGTSHLLHLILSILTGGIWLIIWIVAAIKFGGWRCTECGSKKISQVN